MSRSLLFALLLAASARAQPPAKDAAPREPDAALWTTKLTVSPAAAPTPALKFELLPPARDRFAGNAAVGYQRAVVLRPPWPRGPAQAREQGETFDRWEQLPVEQLPTAKMAALLQAYGDVLDETADAARRRTCDWQTERLTAETVSRLLPAVQGNREVMRILSLKSRMELGEKKFPAALHTLQTGLQMSRHVGEGATVIELLVGQSLAATMLGRVHDWVGREGSPNLYWALTALPRPFINPRPGLDGEARFQDSFLPMIKEMERGPVSDEAATTSLTTWIKALAGGSAGELGGLEAFAQNFSVASAAAVQGPAAKKELIARGLAKKDVDAMPNTQAVLLRIVYRHRDIWDDQVKLFSLPIHRALPEMDKVEQQVKKAKADAKGDAIFAVMALLYPTVQKVHFSHARLERRVAQLRALEAVRLQIAADGGKVPAALAAVTVVPVPDDPFTGKPFQYAATAAGFTLTAPRLKPDEPNMGEHVYEVTVRK